MQIFQIFVHLLFNVIHFKFTEKGLSLGLKPKSINDILKVFFRKYFEGLLHFGDGVVNVFAKLHVLKSIYTGFLEMAEALNLKFGREDIAEEKLFGLLYFGGVDAN
jgi:hypothetical protein